MVYDLPTSLEIGGEEYEIRSDYRAILDICIALSDPELDEQSRAITSLIIFYPDFHQMPQAAWQEAIEKCFWFINGGDDQQGPKGPRLMDWAQDFKLIAAPINRVLGEEVRSVEYLHWWSFLSAYMEIGECTFSQVVRIRDKLKRHKKLDKSDREWYSKNRSLVDFKRKYTEKDEDFIEQWTGNNSDSPSVDDLPPIGGFHGD